MKYDWDKLEQEFMNWHGDLGDLSRMAFDTLYGTIRSMRWKGLAGMDMGMREAVKENFQQVMKLTFFRLFQLQTQPNFSFVPKEPERCGVGYGTFGWDYNPETIHEAVKQGALIDTAEGYGFGRVETRLGKVLKDIPEADITTKVRRDHMSPQSIENAMFRSRKKLGLTPHYQLHYPHFKYPKAISQLADFRSQGLIKSVGMGNCSVDQIESAQRLLSDYLGDPLHSVQVCFNLLDQRVKHTVIPYCQERSILVIAYSPLGQHHQKLMTPDLANMAQKYETSPATVALSWILSFPGVMPIPQTNNLEHLKQNMEAKDLILGKEDVKELTHSYELL